MTIWPNPSNREEKSWAWKSKDFGFQHRTPQTNWLFATMIPLYLYYLDLLALCEVDILDSIFLLLYVAVLYKEPDMGCIYYALSGRVYTGLAKSL